MPKGARHNRWKGGRNYDGQGYIKIWNPEHPFCNNHGYVLEHRLIMEKYLGRYLNESEVVHHKNEIRDDNRLENLQLMSKEDHNTHHNKRDLSNRVCFICGGKARIEKNANGRLYEHWHKLNDNVICGRCSSYRRNVLKLS
jgi:hypothetical protein